MAVITELPGLEATILVNGAAAKEYIDDSADDEQDQPDCPTVVKYIESVPGASFSIRFVKDKKFRHSSHHIAYKVAVDGIRTSLLHADRTSRNKRWETTRKEMTLGNPKDGYKKGRFRFAKLDVVNDDDLSVEEKKNLFEQAKDLGTLKVLVYHMKPDEKRERSSGKRFAYSEPVVNRVAEKALKGREIDCRTDFDCIPAPSHRPSETRSIYEDPEKRHFAVFEFRYRSKEGLMKEGIIPRPRPADEVDGMSEAEVRRLAREFLELRRNQSTNGDVKVKTEAKRGIKRDASDMGDATFMSRYKARRLNGGSLEVDLTDD